MGIRQIYCRMGTMLGAGSRATNPKEAHYCC
ncbi:hypothetical protein HU200_039925 [Digitaria exilis]|uniref:Uncharacterized protein n=1 Tax=Digitaria exilis TaxID=1010633 RepID=A0A835B714_9POAL|nr:hypothetical protein HU200_039925 [Digitaria exilis]